MCLECPTPCARQLDETHHADPCAACALGRWQAVGCQPAGDALAARIEQHVLEPLERHVPAAAELVETVRRCGGCAHARHALGSVEPHPDPGVVV